jgi:SPP1 gp7 family putative phage head morphogenesis protein
MYSRFRALKGAIRHAIVDQDALGLRDRPENQAEPTPPGSQAFAFSRDPLKVDEFMGWLEEQEQKGVLETIQSDERQLGRAKAPAWTDTYVQSAYRQGVERGRQELQGAGYQAMDIEEQGGIDAAMTAPFHADRLGLMYTRAFNGLKGITFQMNQEISRELTEGLARGENPLEMARRLNKRVDVSLSRARTLARTETIRAHHVATIQEYKNWGAEGVQVQAEWHTAGDARVCERCRALQGRVYHLDEIEEMIPLHPNCRCIALPVDKTGEEEETEGEEAPEPDFSLETDMGYAADVSDNHDQLLTQAARSFGVRKSELKSRLDDKLQRMTDEAQVVIRAPRGLTARIINDGRFKSQFESGDSGGLFSPEVREKFEHNFFGYDPNTAPEDRPIYGMLARNADSASGRQYGDAIFRLKDDVKTRTSWVDGDSMDATANGRFATFSPSMVTKPDTDSLYLPPPDRFNDVDEYVDHVGIREGHMFYTEAQVHKGVSTDDIEEVVFEREPSQRAKKALEKNNIPWRMKEWD